MKYDVVCARMSLICYIPVANILGKISIRMDDKKE